MDILEDSPSVANSLFTKIKDCVMLNPEKPKITRTRKKIEISLRFRIRPTQKNDEVARPLQIRLTVNGETASDYSSGVCIIPTRWDQKLQRVTGRSAGVAEMNERLGEVELQHREILRELKRRHSQGQGPLPTAKLVRQEFLSPGSTEYTLLTCYTRFLDFIDEQTGQEDGLAEKTLQRYYHTRKLLRLFLEHTGEAKLKAVAVNTAWGRRFHSWLQTRPGKGGGRMKKDSANYYLGCVRKALDFALEEEQISKNPLDKFRPKRGKGKEVYFLEPEHVNRLMGLQLTGEISTALWWAKLMCLTGLDYVDAVIYAKNRNEYEKPSLAGRTKIVIKRSKPPRNYCEILLLPEVEELFAIYPTGPDAYTLADVNRNLKVIQDAIGFTLPFTSKICRKTAGAHFLRMGFQMSTVSKILGHSSIRTTEQHYVRVVSSHVDNEIERVSRMGETRSIRPVLNSQPFFKTA